VVYLLTVPAPLPMFALTAGFLVNNEEAVLWKEEAVAYLGYFR